MTEQSNVDMETPLLDEIFAENTDADTLSDSDEIYLSFRQTVDPGLMAAHFDLAPGKSSALRSRRDGERFVDQPLRSHILNGAAFGARLNHALRELNSEAALSNSELLNVLAMFTCHDLHKSEDAQRRRANADSKTGDEYDIPDDELRHYIEKLRLNELDVETSFCDYKASALRAEEGSGRHRSVSSIHFTAHSDWIRLLDAAAALSKPQNITRLKRRLNALEPDVELAYHSINDSKGITTNLLNASVGDYLAQETTAEPIVYFQEGVVYLTPSDTDIHQTLTSTPGTELMGEMTDHYVSHLHDEVESFADLEQVKNSLTGKWGYGYIVVGQSAYLLYGLEQTEEAMRSLVEDKSNYTDWSVYSAYTKGTLSALQEGVTEELPESHRNTQALGVYFGAMEKELFRRLRYDDTVGPVLDVAEALGLPEVTEYFERITADGTWSTCSPDLTTTQIDAATTHLNETEHNLDGITSDGYTLTSSKAWSHVVAHAYLNSTRADGTKRSELPLADVLADASEAFFDAFTSWNDEWDETIRGDWDASASASEKVSKVKTRLLGPFDQSTRDYIARFVSVNGKPLADAETNKTKLDQMEKDSQSHICLLCRDLLIGGTSLKRDFGTSEDVVGVPLGFTHQKGVSASGNEPEAVVCAQCDLETTLRNSIHDMDKDDSHNYLYVAPDYFYSPADMAIQSRIRRQFKADSGFTLLELANEIITGNPSDRADSIERVLEVFKTDDDYRDYNEFIHNYDTAISDINSMGVYRLEPPRGITSNMDSGEQSAQTARWLLDTMFSLVVSWTTASRVLLTPSPLPTTDFTDFPEMVKLEQAPGAVTDFLGGDTISISRRSDMGLEPEEYQFKTLTNPEITSTQGTPDWSDVDNTLSPPKTATDGGSKARLVQLQSTTEESGSPLDKTGSLTLNTEFGTALYKLASLLYISQRRYGVDVRRLTTTLDRTKQPFPAASLMLKGNNKLVDYSALSAASILDTLTNYTMSNTVNSLAHSGFETLHPQKHKDSNYEYERLFRVATEAVMNSDEMGSPEELKETVANKIMDTATRTIDHDTYATKEYTRAPAEDFAEVFIDEIFIGLCNSNPFALNQNENDLASGYNAALRRHEKAWLTSQTTN